MFMMKGLMIAMIRGKFLRSGDDIREIIALRERVFVREMGLPQAWVRDDQDAMAVYALVFDESDAPGGTGRLAIDDDRFMLGRICVAKEVRGQGLGDLILRMLLLRAREMDAPAVYVKALPDAVPLYQRYGFRAVGGVADEEGAPRQLMRAMKDEIDIEGACHKKDGGCAACGKACGGR